jgi:hypothetical protein
MLVSQAEYARLRGVSRQYVGQMVAKGVIKLTGRKVNPDQADAALAAFSDPARPERRAKPQIKPAPVTEPAATPTFEPVAPPRAAGDLPTLLLKTRIKSEVERAKLLEIKAKVEAGKYIDADDVKAAAFNKAHAVRDAVLNIPERLAAVLAAENDPARVHELLAAEIRTALEDLSGDSGRG